MTNKEVAVIEKKLTPVMRDAQDLEIVNERTMVEATTMLSTLNKIGDAMKIEKDKTLRPALDTVAAIRAFWEKPEGMYKNAIALIRGKMTTYQTAAKATADAEAAKLAARVGEGKGKLKVETAVRKMEEIEKPIGSVATDAGMVKFKTVKKFEVMDLSMVPLKYHVADEVAIRKAMLAGIELTGVRYFEEEIPLNFR